MGSRGDSWCNLRNRQTCVFSRLLTNCAFLLPPQAVLPPESPLKVLEVFPRGRLFLLTCHWPEAPPLITCSLWGSRDIDVARR